MGQEELQCSKIETTRVKKGKLSDDRFKLSGEYIPTIKQKAVKSQGKRFDNTLKGTVATQETRDSVEWRLNRTDVSGLPGRFKAWIYQHVVLPKILWPLTIYEFTSNNVEQLENSINSRMRRCWVCQNAFAEQPYLTIPIRYSSIFKVVFKSRKSEKNNSVQALQRS